jgi:TonB-dependent SusC/RagA subfamily outer membrane receptor
MGRSTKLARSACLIFVAALSAAACRRPTDDPVANPGPFVPPPAVAARSGDTITSEQVRDQKVTNAEEMIQGRIAGVEVTRLPSGGISVRIRGGSSVALSNEPLYVIDGMPVHAEQGGAISWLSPHDIERIEVLKDAASTAFWGSRGANGVIVITTKH